MMKWSASLFVAMTLLWTVDLTAQAGSDTQATRININNFSYWVHENGLSGVHPQPETLRVEPGLETIEESAGTFYPLGGTSVVNHDGFLWAGIVEDDEAPALRVGGHTFRSGLVPGRILAKGVAEDPDAPGVRIWRIRRDWQTADLTRDAAEVFNTSIDSVTEEQIAAVRTQYETDWNDWPWQKGAPFYDTDENGIMDAGEEPGLAEADQVVWFVANDLNEAATQRLYGSPPIGLECQVTLWAYDRNDAFEHIVFKRHRLIYKGTADTPDTARIDSMFVTHWANPDIGTPDNDFVGCDTTLDLAYAYNGRVQDKVFEDFEMAPPAVGYAFLQGPLGDFRDGSEGKTNRNLGMTSFTYFNFGSIRHPSFADYQSTILWFSFMNAIYPFCDLGPCDPVIIHYPLAGDPVTRTGEIDGIILPPGDREIALTSGPFSMALGDTQEVILALVGGLGADNRYSVQVMKHHAQWARQLYRDNFKLPPEPEPEAPPLPKHFRLSQNFPNPFNPSTEIRFELPVQRHVTLTIYNTLGQKVKTLVDEMKEAGNYSVAWDGTDERGQPVPSGVYFYRFDTGVMSATKKMILIR